jgi:hypothetical protein
MGEGLFMRNRNGSRNCEIERGFGLFAAEAQPDQVDRPTDSDEQADKGENSLA